MKRVDLERRYWDGVAKLPKDQVDKMVCDSWVSLGDSAKAIVVNTKLKSGKILEIGCGPGRFLIPFALAFPEAHFTGIDISPTMIYHAKEYAKRMEVKNCDFYVTTGRTLPTGYTYDFIYCMCVFQHIDRTGVKAYLKEIGDHLAEGGMARFQYIQGIEAEPFSNHFTHEEMTQWLKDAKLKIKEENIGLIHEQWTWVTAVKEG